MILLQKRKLKKIHVLNNNKNKSLPKIIINDNFERELVLISCLYFNPKRLNKKEFDFLKPLEKKYNEFVYFELSLKWDIDQDNRSHKFEGFDET